MPLVTAVTPRVFYFSWWVRKFALLEPTMKHYLFEYGNCTRNNFDNFE